jgi:hypothetical protein
MKNIKILKKDLYSIINENKQSLDEYKELAKDLSKLKTADEKINAVATFLKMDVNAVKFALAKDFTVLEKDLTKAIAKDIKGNYIGQGASLGPAAKVISKQQAAKEILESSKKLTESEILAIIEKWKTNNKRIALDLEKKAATKAANKTTQTQTPTPVPTPTPAQKGIWERIKDRVRGKNWKTIAAISAAAGLSLYAAWQFVKQTAPNTEGLPPTPPSDGAFPECVLDLLSNGKATMVQDVNNNDVIQLTNTDYPRGILFYTNKRVYDIANNKKGTYSCKGQTLKINENKKLKLIDILLEQIPISKAEQELDDAVKKTQWYLRSPYVTHKMMHEIYNQLNRFYRMGKGKEFLKTFKESGISDKITLKKRVENITAINPDTVRLKNALLQLINKVGGSQNIYEQTANDLKNIDFFWDVQKGSGGSGGTGGTPSPSPATPKPKKMQYHDCSHKTDNFEYGCISPMIADIQRCKGIQPAKGYFGPITRRELGFKVITKDMYDDIMANCRKTPTEPSKYEPAYTAKNLKFNNDSMDYINKEIGKINRSGN